MFSEVYSVLSGRQRAVIWFIVDLIGFATWRPQQKEGGVDQGLHVQGQRMNCKRPHRIGATFVVKGNGGVKDPLNNF